MDSGKSTLVAVLTHGADMRPLLDNGRGSARMAVFRHKHEIESGRTSSISQQVCVGCQLHMRTQPAGCETLGEWDCLVCLCWGEQVYLQHEAWPCQHEIGATLQTLRSHFHQNQHSCLSVGCLAVMLLCRTFC